MFPELACSFLSGSVEGKRDDKLDKGDGHMNECDIALAHFKHGLSL